MALKWIDGLEHYGDVARMTEGVGGGAAWSEVNTGSASAGGWDLSTANPATGGAHLRMIDGEGNAKGIRRVWGAAKQVVGAGYRFEVANLPSREGASGAHSAMILADIRDVSNASHITIVLGTDGSVFVVRGATFAPSGGTGPLGGTTLGRSDPCVARGGYHHFEFKAKIDNSGGYIEIRINEVTVLNLTGIDTQNTANAAAAQFVVGRSGTTSYYSTGVGTFDLDDAFAWDDDASDPENTIVDFVGDKGAYWLKPNADTATSEHSITGSVTAYGAIDEIPPSGIEYLSTAATAARTIVGVEAMPSNVAEVIALMPLIYAIKLDSGSVAYRGGLVSGTDETYGPEDNPSTAYAYLRPGPKTVDPATGAPWANDAAPKLLIERTA